MELRDPTPNWTHSRAVLSDCGKYRYRLERLAGKVTKHPAATFLMLNPSTADAETDDPTIRKCWKFTQRWMFQRMVVVNLFGLRATDPRNLPVHRDPVGPHNLKFVRQALHDARDAGSPVICAWGCSMPKPLRWHAQTVQSLIQSIGGDIRALRLNPQRQPWHPLYLPDRTDPEPYPEMMRKAA